MTTIDPQTAMLAEMGACAYRLGMAFGREAEGADDAARRIEYFQLFERCFFGFRVSVALGLRLARASAAARAPNALGHGERAEREDLRDREDLLDRGVRAEGGPVGPCHRDGGAYDERDRECDRETERASFPLLLRTLHGVAADAAKLPGPEPAALPTLRQLLAQADATRAPARPAGALKARLAGSGAAPLRVLATPPPIGGGPALSPRRATGPPRR